MIEPSGRIEIILTEAQKMDLSNDKILYRDSGDIHRILIFTTDANLNVIP